MRLSDLPKKKSVKDMDYAKSSLFTEEEKFNERFPLGGSLQRCLERYISGTTQLAVASHLGLISDGGVRGMLSRGCDQGLEYFLGDWWQANENDRAYLDKDNPERSLIWSAPYENLAFLCGLLQRWDDLSKVSDWVDETVAPEMKFGTVEDEYTLFFIYLASKLRSQPLRFETEIASHIRNARPKRPKLLLSALDAALSENQKEYEKAMLASLKHFEKHDAEDVPNFNFWVAIPQSLIWAIASKNGLTSPSLPPNLDALVVRRETVGL